MSALFGDIMIGTKLAHYEITQHLGSGGMGDVYQAMDSRLGRSVAIKLLPDAFATDTERVLRFEREARLLASLNHPNVASIFGVDHSASRKFLVMELVLGETLAEKIARGPLPLDEAVSIALQIARGLESAHENGIVHRDLKPANVKVTPDGQVKILDFGLAKAFEEHEDVKLSNSPTLMSASVPGVILGTAAYMSPEQTKGRNADRRSDVWAFGCVLFEVLSGKRAFEGETVSEVFAGILKSEPDWTALPAETPQRLRKLLERCLKKNPSERKQSIGDVRIDLSESRIDDVIPAAVAVPGSRTEKYAWIAAGLLTTVLAIVGYVALKPEPRAVPPVAQFEITLPEGRTFAGAPARMVVSPDGRYVVFPVAAGNGQPNQLWLRRIDSVEARPLSGTEAKPGELDPQSPFWSPDSRTVAFFVTSVPGFGGSSNGISKLKRVDVDGGPVQTLCELPSNQASGTWNSDNVILLSSLASNGVMRIPAGGGVLVAVTTVDKSKETAHLWPRFLPDGRHFLYQAQSPGKRAVYAASTDSKERTLILESNYMVQFVPPHFLLYVDGESLLARTFSLKTFALSGEPALIEKGIVSNANGRPGFSASDTGVLVSTISGLFGPASQTTWVDRKGARTLVGHPGGIFGLRLSPDQRHLAFVKGNGTTQGEIWILDLERGAETRLTAGAAFQSAPVWSPNGKEVIYQAQPPGRSNTSTLYRIQSNAALPPEVVLPPEADILAFPQDWSPDGRFLLFRKAKLGLPASGQLWIADLQEHKTFPYLETTFNKARARFSPDGHWVAYDSSETGVNQVYVQPFPNAGEGKLPISTDGGTHPLWRSDGRELYYIDISGHMMMVSLTLSPVLSAGTPVPLSEVISDPALLSSLSERNTFAVTADGQRFLFSFPLGAARDTPLTVTLNWTSGLK